MADIREALVALLGRPDHAPMSAHDPRDGSCQSCPWPLHEMPPEDIADAILAEFDVTPRGEGEQPGCTGAGDCPATAHTHGCYADTKGHCEHPEEHGWTPPTVKPSVEDLTRAMHAEVCCPCDPRGCDVQDVPEARYARVVLALLPGRTEAEVYREGYDQGLRDAASVSRSEAEVKAETWDEVADYHDRTNAPGIAESTRRDNPYRKGADHV